MKEVRPVVLAHAKRRLRNHRSLAWTFLFPLALVGVFALVFLSQNSLNATLIVVDEDNSIISNGLLSVVSNTSHIELRKENTREAALEALDNGKGDAVLIIPYGLQDASWEIFSNSSARPEITFEVYYRGEDVEEMDIIQILLESLAADINDDIMGGYDGPVSIETHALSEEGWSYVDIMVPLSVSIVMIQASVYSCSNTMAYLNENNLRKRLRCTPMEPPSLAVGIVIVEGTIAGLSATLAAIVGKYLFTVSIGATEFLGVLLLTFLSAYTFSFLGVVIGNASKNQTAAQGLSSLIVMPMVFFSSAYVLPALFPKNLIWLAEISPLGETTHGLRLLFLHNPSMSDMLPLFGSIMVWGAIFALVAYWQERK